MEFGKRVVDFLLVNVYDRNYRNNMDVQVQVVLIELIWLCVTAEALRANIGSKSAISLQRGPVDQKFQVEGVVPITNHSSSQKTKLNDLLYGIKGWTDFSSVLSQCTRLSDGQAGGQNSHR